MCMALIQPQVDFGFNRSLVPLAVFPQQNQPMVSKAGTAIKAALKNMGKTQGWLASEMDVSDNAVSKWVKTGQIARENIVRVARLLELSPDDLLPSDPRSAKLTAYLSPDHPPREHRASERLSSTYALSVTLGVLRQSARAMAEALGVDAIQILEAALDAERKQKPTMLQTQPQDEDGILEHGAYTGALGVEPPELRPVMRVEQHYYPSQVDPYADLASPAQHLPKVKERRG